MFSNKNGKSQDDIRREQQEEYQRNRAASKKVHTFAEIEKVQELQPDDYSNRGLNRMPFKPHPTSIAEVNPNPYDPNGPPGLATNYIDVDCPCVKAIRQSKCDLMFQSFASCHNAVIHQIFKGRAKPMFFQCQGQYSRFMLCLEKNGLKKTLVEEPHNSNIMLPDNRTGLDYVEEESSVTRILDVVDKKSSIYQQESQQEQTPQNKTSGKWFDNTKSF